MNDCGPMLLATRSRRCINSATRSLSSKTGAGGVSLMFDGTGISLPARTATPNGLSSATHTQTANRANATRILFDFVISVLLLEPQKSLPTVDCLLRRWLWRRRRLLATTVRSRRTEDLPLAVLRNHDFHAVRRCNDL